MQNKGGNVSFKEAKKSKIFWLSLMTFCIIIGISRMVNDNAIVIALNNSNTYQAN